MKKIFAAFTIFALASIGTNAMACPKGTTLTGGTGPNHKGGKCVKKADAKKTATKSSNKAKTNKTKEKSTKKV